MIALDYRTDNPRWGISGVYYDSWESYAFALGYLANAAHYENLHPNGLISLHFEQNDKQGAWGKEGRIHYYGADSYLKATFPDWYDCKSKGVNNITYRINSNDYMYSLIYDYDFEVRRYRGYTTADIFPPSPDAYQNVWDELEDHLSDIGLDPDEIDQIQDCYDDGWNE